MSAIEVEQRCDACGTQRALACASLVAGMEIGDPPEPTDPNIIALPECGVCRAREFLARGVASVSPSEHRLAVNALHALLVAADQQAESLRSYFAGEDIAFARAELPWHASAELPPITGVGGSQDPTASAFQAYLAARNPA